jgi:hypothetical protein
VGGIYISYIKVAIAGETNMNQKTKELLKSELGTLMHYCKYSQTALDGVCRIIKILKLNSQDKIQKSPEMQYKQMQMSKSFTQSKHKTNLQ